MPKSKDPKLSRAGVSAYNKPKLTPNHKTSANKPAKKEEVIHAQSRKDKLPVYC